MEYAHSSSGEYISFLHESFFVLRPEPAGTHEATNRCNTLLQQVAMCEQSSDKSYALIAAIGCSDKSPGVNASTFGFDFVCATCCSDKILSRRQNFR